MARTNSSARAAGARFERLIADHLAAHGFDFADRKVKTGALDKGDIGGVRLSTGGRVVIECKDTAKMALGPWLNEAEVERVNDGAVVGLVAHKRHGIGPAGQQIVSMTVDDLIALLTGHRPSYASSEPNGLAT